MGSVGTPVNLWSALSGFDELWSPRILAQVNDHDLRVVKVQGEFVWHRHIGMDELFLVLEGTLDIDLRVDGVERTVHLARGDAFVVPADVPHRPRSTDGAQVLLVEPTGMVSTGDFDGSVPEHIDSTTGRTLATPPPTWRRHPGGAVR